MSTAVRESVANDVLIPSKQKGDKFDRLALSKGYKIFQAFESNERISFVELLSTQTGTSILTIIPEDHSYILDCSVYKVEQHAADETISIGIEPLENKIMSEYFTGNYNKQISLTGDSPLAKLHLNKLIQQTRRLRSCFANLEAYLVLFFGEWMSISNANVEMYMFIENYNASLKQRMSIAFDLRNIFKRTGEQIDVMCRKIREQFYDIISSNEEPYMVKCYEHMSLPQEYLENCQLQITKKAQLKKELAKATEVFAEISIELHKAKDEASKQKLLKSQSDCMKKLYTIHEEYDELVLKIDKVLSENTCMFQQIVANFASLMPK